MHKETKNINISLETYMYLQSENTRLREQFRVAFEALKIVRPYLDKETHAGAFAVSKALNKIREMEKNK